MSVQFEHSLEVNCSSAEAFQLVDDLPRTPEWLAPCVRLVNVSSDSNAEGDKLKYTYKQGSKSATMDGEIIKRVPDRQLVCRYADSMFEVIVDMANEDSGSGTKLTHVITITPKRFFAKLLQPLIRIGIRKQTCAAMAKLKLLLENSR